ncbi:MAG: cytochrome c [Gemmatimonadetes bacterium]|uniref:Cytochrome c n=1 Tax=Candidatus Kutchimonas denitrificans TaxID=3056748 RepID=A0AAE5CBT5_9BACT|nr:cytochrome c [Gemmatimonadota bacterium]NIR76262.1 cytochrome c [Candidatus Kutchimonas denitrificans]NIS02285.1 cytochrome c [Gemmatimonadota bacterium]NIT68104.1 cytochrome c [Gemmatimonadota bacterium]NIU54328.1 c-type cytochrome [Gemmatimonadota bacterium]
MNRLRDYLRHPFWLAIALLVAAYIVFEFGVAYLPPLFGVRSAPIPDSVLLQYLITAAVGILIYVSDNEERWKRFKEPVGTLLVDPGLRWLRTALLVLVPLAVGWLTYSQVRPGVAAPVQLRSIHPAPPTSISFRGRTIRLTGLENPLRADGSIEEDYEVGKRVYYGNCLPCHGDLLDGNGHYAHGFNPPPLAFTDNGTIPQLTESFVFWRIAKGGPGLPTEGTPWNSAMPAWEPILTEDEIWAVTIFLYEQTGWTPRTWEHEGEAGAEGGHD